MFSLKKLPHDAQIKIDSIMFTPDEPEIMGFVNLKDEYEFEFGGHMEGFTSRDDLIYIVMYCTVESK